MGGAKGKTDTFMLSRQASSLTVSIESDPNVFLVFDPIGLTENYSTCPLLVDSFENPQ